MPATRYNLTGIKGVDFLRKIVVNLTSGSVDNATFPIRVFNRHDETGAAVCTATAEVLDAATSTIQIKIDKLEMDKLDPAKVYAWQLEGVAQDQEGEVLAQGRFYVEPRYTEGGGNP